MDELKKQGLQKKLLASRLNYIKQLPGKIEKIEETWELLTDNPWNVERFQTFYRMVHTIAGSGGTFGLPELGDAARLLETTIKPQLESGEQPSDKERDNIILNLKHLIAISETSLQKTAEPTAKNVSKKTTVAKKSRQEKSLIYLVDNDEKNSKDLATQIDNYGYTVQTFSTLSKFNKAFQATVPTVIIMETQLPDGDGCKALSIIHKGQSQYIPTIFITKKSDLNTRLKTVKAGGRAFFNKPVNVTDLIDELDQIVDVNDSEPFRILIVDDSVSMAKYFSLILRDAGMDTVVVTDPLTVMEPLESFRPDLILMDLYMPGCSGLELARVIRQQSAFVSIPIVYLSGETDLKKQLAAMSLGGDDFLTKSIQAEHLVLSVTSRVKRTRTLRNFMIRDGLTGLYNHTQTKEFLDLEIERAKRDSRPMAFAMIDIDKFKLVNDTYGHPTGDLVIKSLSRLLKQRLRKTDLVGRYGGEEFAIILINTGAETAERIFNELRVAFAKIQHRFEDIVFSKTFSCGVAIYPGYEDGTAMNNAADAALYKAKDGGRNQVVFAKE
ncbi:MAG: diguanylate cyclase [Magnetococcales bacterium]|nr:diguanylate cyclase [Magnetococcales bacterium]